MDQLMKDNIIFPVTIILACVILGGFFYTSQVSKQKSIEKQLLVKQEEERRVGELRKECSSSALDRAKEQFNLVAVREVDGKKFRPIGNVKTGKSYDGYYEEDYSKYFTRCLQEVGL
jgi:hypothetical protein